MNLLAFDTSTEILSVAVGRGAGPSARQWVYTGAGAAQASAALIPCVLGLLQEAGLLLHQLDAICFGAGPGSFTGLRTACSVAQGLAFGAEVPVLQVNTLMAVAEEARFTEIADVPACRVTALLDARMDEMYAGSFVWEGGRWADAGPSALLRPEALQAADALLAGNVFGVYSGRLGADYGGLTGARQVVALPTATAMLRLAPALWDAGLAVPAHQALPHYIRDKVAQTTAERERDKAAARDAASANTGRAAP
ncbi:MAG: tRNA (adenosine(37)-N6)-threonylcarbamoyltransferase complex dimerization subunit type 1 TsaB [Burkholderiales bacterium PBB4]|nr:MAG: tRNA (adenosine(37)-N6)-threonylcarbamoyltransferase complex dimerization subunit type 1 TsaB [Burkholderiales bacterium PBB4]